MTHRKISVAAGLVNIFGVLIFSLGFTNPYITQFSPTVFSTFGLVSIMLWGLAYIAAAYGEVNPKLYLVFALEKAVYFATWCYWMSEHALQLGFVYSQSALAGTFYVLYGPLDLLFSICFAAIAYRAMLKTR